MKTNTITLFLFVALSFGVGRAADESAPAAAPAATPAKVQSPGGAPPVNGVYTGWAPLPEMRGDDESEWFRLHRLAIKGKVVELSGEPVVIKDGELLYSASDGGFITYKGEIYEKDGKLRIRLRFVETEEDYLPAPPKGGWPDKDLPIVIQDRVSFSVDGIKYAFQDHGVEKATKVTDELKLPQGWVCWPLRHSGIVLKITTDDQVKRLLGEGVFRKNEGDSGGRWFVDAERSATLHVVGYTDSVIGEVTIEEGVNVELKKDELEKATSKWFNPNEGFGNWQDLRLGSTKEEVIENLGLPVKKIEPDQFLYQTRCTCELESFFTLFFQKDRLVKIVLSSPAG